MKQDEDPKEHSKKEPEEKEIKKEHEEVSPKDKETPTKTFMPEPREMSEDITAPAESDADQSGFKTTNIDLASVSSEHTLDDLAVEAPSTMGAGGFAGSARPSTGFHRMSDADSSPRMRPVGSRMGGGVLSGHKDSKPNRMLPIVILALVAVGVLGATVYLLKGGSLRKASTPSPSPQSPAVVESPSPSPSPEIVLNRADFKMRVLNGTIKSGLAATVASKLKDLGYKIDKTANAPSQAVTQTIIKLKASTASLSAQLIKDLSPDYEATIGAVLRETDSADGEITLGAK